MDIQKEREAFESAMFKLADGQTKNEINPVNGQYMYGVMEVMWKVWQEAKAQAIPEGFVVVPKEPTQELLNKMQDFFVGAFENGLTGGQSIHCAYKAMIEAQEPAND